MNINKLFNLDGKVAVITGASQGIGRDMAKLLGHAGAKVALVARNKEKLRALADEMKGEGIDTMFYPCDITKVDHISEMMNEVYNHFGQIDILINNAGINIPKPVDEVTEKDWDTVLDLNLKSAFFCCQAAGKYMKDQNKGKIINISSQMAQVGYFNRAAYCSSKGGVMQLTRSLAIEWSSHQINVNSIAPTFIETPMTEKMFDDPNFKSEVLSRIPLGRLAKSEDLFGALLFLSSSASDMVTGQTLFVDGGWTVW
jgi:NAD(P)-dependent dehydrogenase (short-subunit alcohol dehydrogenase family)